MDEVISAILMKNLEQKTWITYHEEKLSKDKFQPVINVSDLGWVKPGSGGLWCCLDECWQEFLRNSGIGKIKERTKIRNEFQLKPEAKILAITSDKDLKIATDHFSYKERSGRVYFDFEEMSIKCDGLFIQLYQDGLFGGTYYKFYGWDVSSLLLFNYDMIANII